MSLDLRSSIAAAIFLLVLAMAASGGAPSLEPRVLVPLGPEGCEPDFTCSNDPQDVVAADLDGNGAMDLVTANNGSDDLTVLLNDGDGMLVLRATLAAGSGPTGVGVADFDGDQSLDLAVVNGLDSNVAVFPGNGDGSFGDPVSVDVGLFPESIVVADFDGDGNPDFATADLFGDTVTVRLGTGDGSFAEAVTVDVPIGPNAMTAGDFDEDGVLDLAVTFDDSFPGEAAILLGDGSGDFGVQMPTLTTGDAPLGIAAGDLNGDDSLDLAVANWFDDTVSVYFGNGDGSFDEGPVLDAGIAPEDVEIADLDGDGANDVLTLDSLGSEEADGLLLVVPGFGDGTFDPIATFEVGAAPSSIAVADLDADGGLDVVTAHFDSDDLAVLLNGAGGSGCVGDCNGDGMVSINELITGVNMALELQPVSNCPEIDRDANGMISIAELIAAVNNALDGCA